MNKLIVDIPLDVPDDKKEDYLENYKRITKETGKLLFLAGDQRIEHLNDDFYGENIHADDADPEHLFQIASKSKIKLLATQFGLITRYADKYRDIDYIVKLNSKTNLTNTEPFSELLTSIDDVVELKKESQVNILAVGYTVYLGSKRESEMLKTASSIIKNAHDNGLIVVLWMYPRGESIQNEKDPHLIAGGVGVAVSLGADFVKVNCINTKDFFNEAIKSSGKVGMICAGGSLTEEFLDNVKFQIDNGARGIAVGRNIHQKSLEEAIIIANKIYSLCIN